MNTTASVEHPSAVETLLDNYIGAGRAIIVTYITEQTGARKGN